MKEGEEEAYRQVWPELENLTILRQTKLQVIEAGYMDPEDKIKGSEQHYDFFESLLTGFSVSDVLYLFIYDDAW